MAEEANTVVVMEEASTAPVSFGRSKTAQLLQIEPLMQDFDMETKVRTIDAHLDEKVEPELRGTDIGHKLSIEKAMQELGINYMEEMKKGNNLKILERLFARIAIKDKLSSGTFLTKARERVRQAKVERLNSELKALSQARN